MSLVYHSTMEPDFLRTLFATESVQIGAFRCAPDHPSFHDTGPSRRHCFVFPRTAVRIEHEHERPFVANPNTVTFYNRGQAYARQPISASGDRCDWFAVDPAIVRDVVRCVDPEADSRPEPFRLTRGFTDARTYFLQRRLFEQIERGAAPDPLAIEECVVWLLDRVVRTAYQKPDAVQKERARQLAADTEALLSERWNDGLTLGEIARAVGSSVFHLCRMFRRETGLTLQEYRHGLRTRFALEQINDRNKGLIAVAFDCGYCAHSHFTAAFRHEFGLTPDAVRKQARF